MWDDVGWEIRKDWVTSKAMRLGGVRGNVGWGIRKDRVWSRAMGFTSKAMWFREEKNPRGGDREVQEKKKCKDWLCPSLEQEFSCIGLVDLTDSTGVRGRDF